MTESNTLQDYLDRNSTAVMSGDWETYKAGIILPFYLVTQAANITVTTPEDLRAGFDAFCQTLQIQKVTDFLRLVETAKQLDQDLITGRYVTHMMAGSHRIIPPYTSQITLRRDDGVWRAASMTNALANSRWPLLMPSVADTSLKADTGLTADTSLKEGQTK